MASSVKVVRVFEGKKSRRTQSRRFFWSAVARNGEVVAQSEAYTRWYDARIGASRAFPRAKIERT